MGHDVDTAPEEGLGGAADSRVWESAQMESRMFVTQDMDFSDLRKFVPGTHAGILLIRLHAPSWRRLAARVVEILHVENASSLSGCFVVVTETKARIVRPG
jgi:predicted nuclease of predicted toxin-antitoxin system